MLSLYTKGINGGILLRPWTRRQMSPSCGEPLNKLMAEQNVMQRTKQLPSTEARSHRPSSLLKAGKTHFFKRDPISDKREILGNGTDIYCRSSDESNQEL